MSEELKDERGAFDEIRDALSETYGFASTSPRAQENINFVLDKLDEIEQARAAQPPAAIEDNMSNQALKDERAASELYVWFADNKGSERDGERFLRAWTSEVSKIEGLRNAIGREPTTYRAARPPAAEGARPEEWPKRAEAIEIYKKIRAQAHLNPIGYIEASELEKLGAPESEFGDDVEPHVRLWHPANPPSRALIPVFAAPASSASERTAEDAGGDEAVVRPAPVNKAAGLTQEQREVIGEAINLFARGWQAKQIGVLNALLTTTQPNAEAVTAREEKATLTNEQLLDHFDVPGLNLEATLDGPDLRALLGAVRTLLSRSKGE
jgi:hypothetical protein